MVCNMSIKTGMEVTKAEQRAKKEEIRMYEDFIKMTEQDIKIIHNPRMREEGEKQIREFKKILKTLKNDF